MKTTPLADHAHRQQALDTSASFIVQAPAGSGKTELLTLRFLKLLAACEQPEQVLAITFTRKAANEMSRRITATLHWAAACTARESELATPWEAQRLAIAREVLAQDAQRHWHLLQNPARLRVQTIDSFCFYLAEQLPVLSQLGGNPRVADDVTPCFTDAISNTLAQLESNTPLAEDIAAVLTHLDNDIGKTERLLVNLLYKRDQWLSHVLDIRSSFADARGYLQQSLAELVSESLQDARKALHPYADELLPLLNFAATNLEAAGTPPVPDYVPLKALPASSYAAMPYWLFLVDTLLTRNTEAPSWRRTVNVNNGFPAGDKSDKSHTVLCKQRKEAMSALLASLAMDDDALAALDYLRTLPDPELSDASWQFLAALTRVLAHLSTELLLSFRQFRLIDYTQASSAARTALGEADSPTDLALSLDHRIQHVLVDEFQDTSRMQLDILRQITAGWEPGDGRTLFLVGDAMQSCYAFRNANVGIYLQVRAHGIGNIPLIPLTLEANFRSQKLIVDWVNRIFASAFPQQANISRGAVPYTQSVAVHEALDVQRVRVSVLTHEPEAQEQAKQAEAIAVISRIQALQRLHPEHSIAVLVRARPHLKHIIPALRAAGIHWHATDIDRLTTLPVIEDLLSLTRAVLNQADRLAWLALLRAPWCGLGIADLHAVASHAGAGSIWNALNRLETIADLSEDARERLQGIYPALQFAIRSRFHTSLRTVIEQTWRLLEGEAIAAGALELESIAHYLNLLSEHETGYGILDIDRFCDTVAGAFVPNRSAEDMGAAPGIHLLTMHKAKGLEYDHVILPGLARLPNSDDRPLLQWHERLNAAGTPRLFLATLTRAGAESDALYELLRHEQQYKTLLENTRLLYIAVTRARASVQLLATLSRNSKGELQPPRASLLSRIWRELRVQQQVEEMPVIGADRATGSRAVIPQAYTDYPPLTPIRRLARPLQARPLDSQFTLQLNPELQQQLAAGTVAHDGAALEPFTLQIEAAVGKLIHRSLEAIGKSGDLELDAGRLSAIRRGWQLQLRHLVAGPELTHWLQVVETGVTETLRNPELRWLFQSADAADAFELSLTRSQHGELQQFRIDRSVIDAQGTRWIIDYKSALPAPQQPAAEFIASQCRLYARQLHNYRELLARIEPRPLQCALLFTGLGQLVRID